MDVPRRSIYYKPKARPKATDPALTDRVKLAMQRFPAYGYRRLAIVFGENKKPIRRILKIKGWQVRKRPQGFRPRAKALLSVIHQSDERWATDICHVCCGRDRRGALAAVIDCCTPRDPRLAFMQQCPSNRGGRGRESLDQPPGAPATR